MQSTRTNTERKVISEHGTWQIIFDSWWHRFTINPSHKNTMWWTFFPITFVYLSYTWLPAWCNDLWYELFCLMDVVIDYSVKHRFRELPLYYAWMKRVISCLKCGIYMNLTAHWGNGQRIILMFRSMLVYWKRWLECCNLIRKFVSGGFRLQAVATSVCTLLSPSFFVSLCQA